MKSGKYAFVQFGGGVKCNMTYNEYIINSKELYHHGIKGQRWGIRRYQNKDGSLTDAGKKRYSKNLIRMHKGTQGTFLKNLGRDMYTRSVKDKVKSSITDSRIAEIQEARKIYKKKMYERDLAAFEWYDLVDSYAKKMNDFDAATMAEKKRPDLRKMIDYSTEVRIVSDYLEACSKVADDIIGEYGNVPLYNKNNSWTLRKDIGKVVKDMIDSGEIDLDRKIR